MELYLVRHGKTDWNAQGKLQGNIDIHLNDEGKKSAIELGEKLKNVDFDRIYSSPLSRAYETAQLICGQRQIPIFTDNRLREISFGVMEGITYEEWTKPESPYRFFFQEDVTQYNPPKDGETIDSICVRTKEFMQTYQGYVFAEVLTHLDFGYGFTVMEETYYSLHDDNHFTGFMFGDFLPIAQDSA